VGGLTARTYPVLDCSNDSITSSMKLRFTKSIAFVSVLGAAVWAVVPQAQPQTQPGLAIQLYVGYAGLNITGAVGTVYSIQCVTNLAQTNDWVALTNLTLPGSPYLWVDRTVSATSQRFYRAFGGLTNMAWIPPGTFAMGSPTNETLRATNEFREKQHLVTLTKGFFMGKFEVTQGEYLAVIGTNPSAFSGDLSRPVEQVSWNDATNYCAKLTAREAAAGRMAAGWVYRLPTEAEWEYACRAGTSTPFHYGNDLRSGMANFDGRLEYVGGSGTVTNLSGTYLARTTRVGSYQPNAFGLHDMHGNVDEWCQDWEADYPAGSVTDPQGPPSGFRRMTRGGAWYYPAAYCRAAQRDPADPTYRSHEVGFRVVLAQSQP
jgi:formylglycine-generating enzyme required for sulfatase activity